MRIAATAMPLTITNTDAGPPLTAPTAPVSARAAGDRALRPGAGAAGTGVGETADAVAISTAARTRQELDAAILSLRRLGFLLDRLDQITGSAAPGDPTVVIGLAAEVGAAAQELGRSFGAEGDAPGPIPAGKPFSSVASASPGDGAATPSVSREAGAPTTAPASSALSEVQPSLGRGEVCGDAGAGTPTVRDAGRGDHGPPPASYARAATEVAASGPTREACAAVAGVLLGRALAALAVVKLRLLAIPAPRAIALDGSATLSAATPGAVAEMTRCEVQVALAMAQVTGRRDWADQPGRARSSWRGWIGAALARHGAGWWHDEGERLRIARAGFVTVLAGAAAAALWVATTLDLTLPRIACALVAAVLFAAGMWRAIGKWLPRGTSIALDPERTPFA